MANNASEPEYGPDFYRDRRRETLHGAHVILAVVMEQFPVTSTIDVGCGTGTWLAAARDLGVQTAKGLEGEWLNSNLLDSPDLDVQFVDLELPLRDQESYDLCISLEVAEHLTPARGPGFVSDLCSLAPVVLFSAAIPGQGGTGHINERWLSYWATLFSEHGFVLWDGIRSVVWDDPAIPFWYRQNTVVFAVPELVPSLPTCGPLDVVHPEPFLSLAHPRSQRPLRRLFDAVVERARKSST